MDSPIRKTRYNARVYSSKNEDELKQEMTNIGSEPPGIARMIRKVFHYVVKVDGLRTPAVLILKEEMLAKGGDCSIHKDAIICKEDRSSCLLMGTYKQYIQMLADLRSQPFGLKFLAEEIRQAIDNCRKSDFTTPPDTEIDKPLIEMYEKLKQRTLIMGILNITPDSFYDGGRNYDLESAFTHVMKMVDDGADIIDIGGESTRPGSDPVSADEELSRVIPIIERLAGKINIPISIDTNKADVAKKAIDAGVSIINDITGLESIEMRELAVKHKLPVVVMHMKGIPKSMQETPHYDNLISEIMAFLRDRTEDIINAGLPKEYIFIDPGIGFGKTFENNMEIIKKLADFKSLGFPMLIGTSRKAFIGKATGDLPVDDRIMGTAATIALSINNGANIVRVHDVKQMALVAKMTDSIIR